MKLLRFWFRNARPTALPQSLLPATLALCMAASASHSHEGFSLWLGLIAVFGVVMGHLAMNLFDDYFDYRVKKADFRDRMQHKGMRARISKCTYLKSGEATLNQLLIACFVFGFLSLAAGAVIWYFRGFTILLIALVTALLGLQYSGAPLRLSYHGLGELVIGLMFGPLLMAGVYFSASGVFEPSVIIISVSVGLLVANIVYVHSIMDYEPDCEVGKMTFAVLLRDRRLMLLCLFLLLVTAFGIIVVGVVKGWLSAYSLLVFLTLPMAVSLFYLMTEFVRNPARSFTPRFWMGPMSNWKRLQTIGIEWFMIRWLTARNLLSFFCLILCIVCFI
ncbi:MAG: prenyltransferase [Tannerella sp.]|jgi:1,4-dihydroxy-2-naphthoate octaprenyltransferase|nr:prenyltransferase [Tannerella sp.]